MGMTEGVHVLSRASSATAVRNWTTPGASAIAWHISRPNANPPHLKCVTCVCQNMKLVICDFN